MPTITVARRATTRSVSRAALRGRQTASRSSNASQPAGPAPPNDDPPDDDPEPQGDGNPDGNPDDPQDDGFNPDTPDNSEPDDENTAAEDLTHAIRLLARSVKSDREKDSIRVREPDPFDGSDPKLLRVFLIQCRLCFQAKPGSFKSDSAKVNYALSYLKGMALEWFEPGLISEEEPDWLNDFSEFRDELTTNFGPHDAVGDAEDELEALKMRDNQRITKYNSLFNRYAALVDWGHSALRHQYYKGLPPRIKDEIAHVGKPTTLNSLRTLAQSIDSRYWARQGEITRENKANNSAKKDKPSHNDKKSDSKGESSKSNPNSANPANKSAKSDKPSNSASSFKKPDLSNKLGKDGKLTPEERKRRFDNNLCLFCGGAGHAAKDCPKSTSSAAKAKARSAKAEKSDAKLEDSKN